MVAIGVESGSTSVLIGHVDTACPTGIRAVVEPEDAVENAGVAGRGGDPYRLADQDRIGQDDIAATRSLISNVYSTAVSTCVAGYGGVQEAEVTKFDVQTASLFAGIVIGDDIVRQRAQNLIDEQPTAITIRRVFSTIVADDVAIQEDVVRLLHAYSTAIVVRFVVIDVVVAQHRIVAVPQIDPAAPFCGVAVDVTVAQREGGADDAHPAAGIIPSQPAAAQSARVAAGDAQPLDSNRVGILGDVDHPSLSPRVERGRIGLRVRRRGPVVGIVTAAQREVLADIDRLHHAVAQLRTGAIPGHLDQTVGAGRVHRILHARKVGGEALDARVADADGVGDLDAVHRLVRRHDDGVGDLLADPHSRRDLDRDREHLFRGGGYLTERTGDGAAQGIDDTTARIGVRDVDGRLPIVQRVGQDDVGGIHRSGADDLDRVGEQFFRVHKAPYRILDDVQSRVTKLVGAKVTGPAQRAELAVYIVAHAGTYARVNSG